MKSLAKQIGARSFRHDRDIVRYFHALGTAAPSGFMWEMGKLFGMVDLPREARRLGIDSPRQIAEGLAVKQLDTPQQMQLALAAFDAGAQNRSLDRRQPLGFENENIASLAGQKAAATEMKSAARALKYDRDLTDQEVVDIAHRWGRSAQRLGLDYPIKPSQLSEPDDREAAQRLRLDNPVKLAEGAMLGKVRKSEATPGQFLLFQQAFKAGVAGKAPPQPVAPQAPEDLASKIDTESLRGEYRQRAQQIKSRFEAGLEAFKGVELPPASPARRTALQQVERKIIDYADAARIVASAQGPSQPLPDPYLTQAKTEIDKRLTGMEKLFFTALEKVDSDPKIPRAPAQARLFSPTGLLESSIFAAMHDPKTALTADEAARLFSAYRTRIQDKTPVATNDQLTFSTAALQQVGTAVLGDKAKLTGPVPAAVAAPTTAAATVAPAHPTYARLLDELIILNNGKFDDGEATKTLRQDGVLKGRIATDFIDGKTARALAAKAMTLSGSDQTQIRELREKIADAFKGKRIEAAADDTPDHSRAVLEGLQHAKRAAQGRAEK